VGDEQIEVKFVIDPAGEVTNFRLFKATGPGRPFMPDTVFTGVSDSVTHLDPVVSTANRYLYRLSSLDVCSNPVIESNVCGNIVLSASSVGLEAFLSWNPYKDYYAGVSKYLIYRDINQAGPVLTGGVYHPDTSYQDDLSFVSGEDIEDEICYTVEAVENDSWSRGSQGFSRSNVACVTVVPEILMANAIIPNSITGNNQISPVLTFLPLKYLFLVYDRWGNRIFETQEHDIPWTGRVNGGDFVPEGAYAYYIKLTTSNGIEVEKKGVITVFYK